MQDHRTVESPFAEQHGPITFPLTVPADVRVSDDGTISREFRVGTHERRGVYVEIRLRDVFSSSPALSITGHTQYRPGADFDTCGQIADVLDDCTPHGTWTRETVDRVAFIWRTYHLSDMQAGCEHQRDAGWTYDTHAGRKCPVCGYGIGTAWKSKPLPLDVLGWVLGWIVSDDPATATRAEV